MKGGNFWFMTTDKAAANISYSSSSGATNVLFLWSFNSNSYDVGSSSAANRWRDVVTDAGGTFTVLHNPGISSTWPSDLSPYNIILDFRLPYNVSHDSNASALASYVQNGGYLFKIWTENGCCGSATTIEETNSILSALGYGSFSRTNNHSGYKNFNISSTLSSNSSIDFSAVVGLSLIHI